MNTYNTARKITKSIASIQYSLHLIMMQNNVTLTFRLEKETQKMKGVFVKCITQEYAKKTRTS